MKKKIVGLYKIREMVHIAISRGANPELANKYLDKKIKQSDGCVVFGLTMTQTYIEFEDFMNNWEGY